MKSFNLIAITALVALAVHLASAAPPVGAVSSNQLTNLYNPRVRLQQQTGPVMLDAGKLKSDVQESLAKQLNANLTPMHPPLKLALPELALNSGAARATPVSQQSDRVLVASTHPTDSRPYGPAEKPVHHPKVKATPEQKALKKELMHLALKATKSDPNEQLLKFNPATGQLEQVEADPSVEHYKKQLRKALKAISSKGLKVDKLSKALGREDDHHGHPHHPAHHATPPVRASGHRVVSHAPHFHDDLVRVDASQGPTAEEIAAADEHHKLVDEVRDNLQDRFNRISDLLYFRPEFMNQLLKVDDATELTPVEAVFKRMVLCNSDEAFCHADLSDLARQLNEDQVEGAQIFEEQAPETVVELEPEAKVEPEFEPEDEEQGLPEYHFEHQDENTADDAKTAHFDGSHDHNGRYSKRTSASAYSYSHTNNRNSKTPNGRVQQLAHEQQQQQHNLNQQTVNGQTYLQQSGFARAANQVADVASKARAAVPAGLNRVPLVARILPQNAAQTPVSYKRPVATPVAANTNNRVPAGYATASASAKAHYRQ